MRAAKAQLSWLALAMLTFPALSAQAQIQVDLKIKRNLFVVYEPIICTVTITNRTGTVLELEDTPRNKWFGFQIERMGGRPVPPINSGYDNRPVQIEPGQKLSRSINLTPLYPMGEFGSYSVRAAIYSKQLGKYFVSPEQNIDITEGRLLWQQTIGVPPGAGEGRTRTYSILAHRLSRNTMLYLRVEDKEEGVVYCTTQLGRFITFGNPDVALDAANEIHILQNTAPKAFLYSHFDVNGNLKKQQGYQAYNTRPYLVRKDDAVMVLGGVAYDPNAKPPVQELPAMTDRPVPLPTPEGGGNPTPEDKRPENLLSH